MLGLVDLFARATRPYLNISMIRCLVRWRLQYYVKVTADALSRNKQAALIIVLVFGPMLFAILLAMAKPILLLIEGHSLQHSVLIWLVLTIMSIFWVGVKKQSLMGGEANRYLQHLPIRHHIVVATDLMVILLLNSLIFLPYVVAVIYLLMEPGRNWSTLPNIFWIAL
ncbi:hypothetical protein [Acinetobacter sp.]|uniref:hypothetical protein n=1 Tax=Acinetobacter sp. TaxID=472 RepID=UPI003BB1CD58